MISVSRLAPSVITAVVALAAAPPGPVAPTAAAAQTPGDGTPVSALEATPLGALPPLALPMPAHRDQNYWGARLQVGHRAGRAGPDLSAIAAGIDLQWHGGSVFGVTGGVQTQDCGDAGCDGTAWLAGARARLNVIAGGPTVARVWGDNSATTTLGAEAGLGYASRVPAGQSGCTADIGVPLSLATRQRTRVVAFFTPGLAWEIGCLDTPSTPATFLTNLGIGAQHLWDRGLDVYLGLQKMYRSGTGYQVGLSVTYTRLP